MRRIRKSQCVVSSFVIHSRKQRRAIVEQRRPQKDADTKFEKADEGLYRLRWGQMTEKLDIQLTSALFTHPPNGQNLIKKFIAVL